VKLFTAAQWAKLLANGKERKSIFKTRPVVKLFTPDASCTWLLTWVEPDQPDLAYGLCDLGLGCPELGYVSLAEIRAIRGRLGLPVERDRWWEPEKTLTEYADEARRAGGVR
jgi:hypothetical protein